MKRHTKWFGILLLAGMLISCGGGGGGDMPSASPGTTNGGTPPNNGGTPPNNGGTPPNNGGTPPGPVSTPGRFEESDAAVSLSGAWTPTSPSFGWSAGTAMQSSAGATATLHLHRDLGQVDRRAEHGERNRAGQRRRG